MPPPPTQNNTSSSADADDEKQGPWKQSDVQAIVLKTPPLTTTTSTTKKRRHTSTSISAEQEQQQHKQQSPPPPAASLSFQSTTTTTAVDKKSTVTTVSASTVTQMNVYDAVLAEASDLWQAASEAQQLGRLKMASSYLLLLHARLVGLGKRFDKAEDVPHHRNHNNIINNNNNNSKKKKNANTATAATTAAAAATAVAATPQTPKATTAGKSTQRSKSKSTTTTADKLLTPNTAKVLSEMLPDDIELDQAMMEHLAKAAAELHAARSGRKRHATEWQAGLTGYDYPSTQSLQQQQQRNGPTTTTTTNEWEVQHRSPSSARHYDATTGAANTGIVWSLGEIRILQTALDKATHDDPPDAAALAKLLGRNPAQVRAFLRNQNTKSRIAADLALPAVPSAATTTTTTTTSGGTMTTAGATTTTNNGNNNNNNKNQKNAHQAADGVDTPRRKGGRGPKPPTTAIHTVPNAECNASLLLLGGFLPPQEDPAQIGKLSHAASKDNSDNKTKDKDNTATASSNQHVGEDDAKPQAKPETHDNKTTQPQQGDPHPKK
eukprot:scaffold2704_cov159-Amphora_coffeaeformis.AAC.2